MTGGFVVVLNGKQGGGIVADESVGCWGGKDVMATGRNCRCCCCGEITTDELEVVVEDDPPSERRVEECAFT